jgi:hypothetical protein
MYRTLPLICALCAAPAWAVHADAAWMTVKVANRQTGRSEYSYVVPGHSLTSSSAGVNCFGTANTANCQGTGTSQTISTPAQGGTYEVTGATLALRLPDGRLAVVNCGSKQNWGFGHQMHPYRDCRIPITESVEAKFNGSDAKLRWPVSIDGKKMESETYKILGVLPGPASPAAPR